MHQKVIAICSWKLKILLERTSVPVDFQIALWCLVIRLQQRRTIALSKADQFVIVSLNVFVGTH